MARFLLNERFKARRLASLPAAPAAMTAAEVAAGTDLIGATDSEELEGIQGFEVQPSSLPMPGYASIKVGTLPGEQNYPDSRLSFYLDDTVKTIYDTFDPLTNGFLALMHDGEDVGDEYVIFPYQVASRVRRLARNVPAIVDVNVAIQVEYEGVIVA